jgi:dephospho-CoA kinase
MLVCITGEIGSGKSTALEIIKAQGYRTFNMDEYIHRIYKKGEIGYKLIQKHFGNTYINNKEVDRKKLGKLVFLNKQYLNKLNKLMIPLMQAQLEQMSIKSTLIFVEMGIFMHQQSAFNKYFDKVIFVDTKESLKNKNLRKKISYLRKFPTKNVGKLKNLTKMKEASQFIVVGNHKNLRNFQTNILKILEIFQK